MYLEISVLTLQITFGLSYVGYDMFTGFDSPFTTELKIYSTTVLPKTTLPPKTTVPPNTTYPPATTNDFFIRPITAKLKCPEEESPSNIGMYEVPSQRDLILFIKKSLMNAFNSYHIKALYFLKDITEATKATRAIVKKCNGQGSDKQAYKACVKEVSTKSEFITKTLVSTLEKKRNNISNFTEEMICNLKLMKADPVQLIKRIAMESASLEFALPGFLRMLGSCSIYCKNKDEKRSSLYKKPSRAKFMTDQQLVVKHYLTKKTYLELLQD